MYLFLLYILFHLYVSNYALVPHYSNSMKYSMLSHNWYVIGETKDFSVNHPKKIMIKNTPISIWRDSNGAFSGIYDVCPHRGASLSNGRIDQKLNCVVCPYHTFKFNKKGRLIQTTGQKSIRQNEHFNLKTDVPYFKVVSLDDWVYLYNEPNYEISHSPYASSNTIWREPEALDNDYRSVCLQKKFKVDARTLSENSLDILHISEVHMFGNKEKPIPLTDKIEKISEGHVKATYEYESSKDSTAYKLYGIKNLIIENEYILPHYTVARVKFGNYVNTIVTSALPVNDEESILFVKAYRNNWVYNIHLLNYLFDKVTSDLMEKTLCEDKGVVESIYQEYKDGNYITKYDELIKYYRDDYKSFVNKNIYKEL